MCKTEMSGRAGDTELVEVHAPHLAPVMGHSHAPFGSRDSMHDNHTSHRSIRITMPYGQMDSRHNSAMVNIEVVGGDEPAAGAEPNNADVEAPAAPRPTPPPVHQRADFKWLIIGGFFMILNAGFLNSVAYLETGHTITHVSGRVSKWGIDMAQGHWTDLGNISLVLGSFLCGAITSGATLGTEKFVLGHRYGTAMIIIGALFSTGALLVRFHHAERLGLCVWSFAAGMQNAMCSSFSGAVVRTTHVTGMFTDIGTCIGHFIRMHTLNDLDTPPDTWKLRILCPQLFGFILGGFLGSFAHEELGVHAAHAVGGTLIGTGMLYMAAASYGAFDGFLKEEEIEHEIERVEREVHQALHEALTRQQSQGGHTPCASRVGVVSVRSGDLDEPTATRRARE
eukprot:TRINITY_DN4204_c0_g1_i2.p1 TRINITY_DN4204_c0_g1~~TRINITY_DN4204_c0_g1_i2.p1  ORF type:complete len:396 (+),score=146.85 TRINITY_DN4204_c0_g1_i2:182-1369(+)